ncbi:MAG: glycosyltransferase family 4 protein [Parcubacteria group bacterium]|nr:glycosyltransferase family 4 protein [Parcubacteria group bacterium]
MKTIAFDARFYGTQVKGLGRYTQELLRHLSKLEHDLQFKIFLNKQGREEWDITDRRFTPVLADVPWYGLAEQRQMPKLIAAANADFAHIPHFNAPWTSATPTILTIHDTILFDHPSRRASTLSWPLYQAKYVAFKQLFRHVIHHSQAVLTVSNYAAGRISHYVPQAKDKIFVTPIAPSSALANIKAGPAEDLGLHIPYILYVGNAYPHKNLEFLIRAFHKLWQTHRDLSLVLVGKLDPFYWRLKDYAQQFDWQGQTPVHFFGYATEPQLATLYANAALYVFPSLDEGFGIPPLEAMAMNTPVLSSSAASMPEVLGQAAQYFDPHSEIEFLQKTQALLADQTKREALITASKEQVSRYSWQTCAAQTLAVYQRLPAGLPAAGGQAGLLNH